MKINTVRVADITIGAGEPFALIAGPCVIESEKSAIYHAEALLKITKRLKIPFIYKASLDKANRTSIKSFRGPGFLQGLEILLKVKKKIGVPVLSDVHCRQHVEEAASVLDIIQIPAFLCRQTDLIIAAAMTKKPINVKKGQFLAPWDIVHVIEKIKSCGNRSIMVTERGSCFGYNNLVSDMRSIPILKKLGIPVIYDATHSVQLPGGLGKASGGQREFIFPLAKAAVAVGVDGLFLEVHKDPRAALSDGPNTIKLDELEKLLKKLKEIDKIVKQG
ncbi:MAG: 3-deoxy-8-phosphooctulonate synthase [Candidatus Omnitrophota bacterium]